LAAEIKWLQLQPTKRKQRGIPMADILMKRIYEPVEPTDGFRILVDRLWPRGIKKENAGIDLWIKDIAPTTALRKELHSGRLAWSVFETLYRTELLNNPALDSFVQRVREKQTVTLLFVGKDTEHNQAKVIAELLKQKI